MIFLTGATGTVGTATVAALRAKGAAFRIGARSLEKVGALDAVHFDFDQPSTYASALRGARVAFLLTPVSEKQLEYTIEFAKAAKAAKVERIVKLSVVGSNLEHGITFQRLHGAGERALVESGAALTFIRATAFMQNFVKHYGVDATQGGPFFLPQGSGKVSWLDVDDAAAVIAEALTDDRHANHSYSLTGPSALGAAEVAETLAAALGKPISYVDVPEAAAQEGMSATGMPAWMVSGLLELHGAIRAGYLAGISPEVELVLGRPATSFPQYAARLAREAGA